MLDQYEIIKTIGESASGTVYQARQRLVDRIVAIKMLSESVVCDETSLKRFQREAKIASSLDHPHIARVYAFGVTPDEGPFLVMEFLEGKTLAAIINECGRLPIERFKSVFAQVCDGLEYAHSKGIIHRDISPSNIMLLSKEGSDEVKILDFGTAHQAADQKSTATSTASQKFAAGTPFYMSPEQCRGEKCDRRSDIYSLGCVMYESLCGRPPFSGETAAAVMLQHLHETARTFNKVDPALSLPPSLVELVFLCLSKDPDSRPQSADVVGRTFSQACDEPTVNVQMAVSSGTATPGKRKAIIGAALIVAALIAIISGAIAIQNIVKTKQAQEQRQAIEKEWAEINGLCAQGGVASEQKKLVEAKKDFYEVLQKVKSLPVSEQETRQALAVLSYTYSRLGKLRILSFQEQVDVSRKAIYFAGKVHGLESEKAAMADYDYALFLAEANAQLDEAERYAANAASKRKVILNDFNQRLGGDQLALMVAVGPLKLAEGRHAAAVSLMGLIKLEQGKYKESADLLKKALKVEREAQGDNDSLTLWTLYRLCCCFERSGDSKQADIVLGDLIRQLEYGTPDISEKDRQGMLMGLIEEFEKKKDLKRKKIAVQALVQISENDYGIDSPEAKRARNMR